MSTTRSLTAPTAVVRTTPARRAGSLRRTSNVDFRLLRTDGGEGIPTDVFDRMAAHGMLTLTIRGHARDLWTGADGAGRMLADASISADADTERNLTRFESTPRIEGSQDLIGQPSRQGFRRQAAALDVPEGHPLELLLFDLPAAALVSGYSISRAMKLEGAPDSAVTPAEVAPFLRSVCTGWSEDGEPFRLVESGVGAPDHPAPPAVEPADPNDSQSWHALDDLGPHWMRRRRRIDALAEGDELIVDTHFRDSHVDADHHETVVHEYTLGAWFDRELRLQELAVTPHVLPYGQCVLASSHVDDLLGTELADLDAAVRRELKGVRGCTHLSDVLTSLTGLAALAPGLIAKGAAFGT